MTNIVELKMKLLLILIAALNLIACANTSDLCLKPIHADDARPDILVIGDSISYGYLPFIQAALPEYDVIHNPCNGKSSKNGVKHIDAWLALRPNWYAVTFNHGAWDVSKSADFGWKTYYKNMRYIAERILKRTPRPLFINTTHVAVNDTSRHVGLEYEYNALMQGLMAALDIPIADVYTVSVLNISDHVNPIEQNDSHWTDKGSKKFAKEILMRLKEEYNIGLKRRGSTK